MTRLALAAVAALALAGTGCGGAETSGVRHEPNLRQAAARTADAPSFVVESLVEGRHEGAVIELACSGAVDNANRRSRLTCTAKPRGREIVTETIVAGGFSYSREDGRDTWTKLDSRGSHDQGLTPARTLEPLRVASRETTRVGEEEVRGEPTVRYSLVVPCKPARLACEGDVDVGVWVDGDGLVRRIELEGDGLSWRMEWFDFGRPVDVEPPPADQVEEPPRPLATVPTPCDEGYASPIGVDEAVGALRRNGFDASVGDQGCAGEIATGINELGRSDVLLACQLYRHARDVGVLETPASAGGPMPKVADRTVANLQCTLFATAAEADGARDRLDRAFAELRR